jgi:hypothetical protein
MIDRWPNKVAITSSSSITTHGQMRRLPHQGARHGTVDHGDASDGVFLLLHLWVLPSSRVILLANDFPPLLSLACGRCDAPGFYLTIMVGQLYWQWSNHDQPGSSPRKPHQPTLMTLLIKSLHMCGQTLVKCTVKQYLNPSDPECLPELLSRSPNFT